MNEVERLKAELKLREAENRRLQIENEVLKKLDEIERRRY
jgi:regulator of replication initiation timing